MTLVAGFSLASAAKSPQRFGRLCDYQVIRGIVLQTIVHKINNLNEIDILTKTVAHLISAQREKLVLGSGSRIQFVPKLTPP